MKILSLTAAVALTATLTPGAVAAHGGPAQPQPVTDVPPIDGSNHNLSDPTPTRRVPSRSASCRTPTWTISAAIRRSSRGRTGPASATSRTTCSPRTRTRSSTR